MMRRSKQALAAACAAALLGAGGIAAAAPAGATADTATCYVKPGVTAPFYASPGGNDWVYSVGPGGGINFNGYGQYVNGTWYYYGNGNGHSDAWFRQYDTTC
ncbi:hypothetical protein [Streptomyces sp. NBC_01477]|uniref:hypothetical protein n=1 Tax=Streptomyces sp. NBC_01477 TaxID=2976015 RepID=UPI002E3467EB|nr:hypothetical protein [Streptomyces sp. NBC_01477]